MRKILFPILYPLSLLFRTAVALRNLFFDLDIFSQTKVDAKVISVGNLSVGGTGKTPLILYLTELPSLTEKKIAVVTRGYGRSSNSAKLYLPSDTISNWQDSGDEPFLLKKRDYNLTISVDSDRVQGALKAIEMGNSELLLLDDGFQHRAIKRDLDIVIIEEPKNYLNRFLLPAGRLREPLNSLKRADIVVFMGSEKDSAFINEYLNPAALLCGGEKEPHSLVKLNSNEELNLSELTGKKLTAFCGLGNPDGFLSTLSSFDPSFVELLKYPDHHIYSEKDLAKIKNDFLSSDSDYLITTGKDALKLPSNFLTGIDVYELRITFSISWGKAEFDKMLNELFFVADL